MDDRVEVKLGQGWVLAYASWLIRFRWLVIVVSMLAVLAAGYGIRFLQVGSNSWSFFDHTRPDVQAFQEVENTYGKTSNVLIALAPSSGEVFTREFIKIIGEAGDRAWQIPYVTRVDSLTNFKHSYALGDDFTVEELVPEPDKVGDADLARIREIALSQPEVVNQLVSSAGDVAAIVLTVVRSRGEEERRTTTQIAEAAQALAEQLEKEYPQLQVYLTGGIMADHALAEAASYDIKHLIPLVIILSLVVLWAGLRSLATTIATTIVVFSSTIVAAGWAGWNGMVLNPVTAAAPVMSMTLAIADCVHVLSGTGQLQHSGYQFRAALMESLRVNWRPILMTSLTTAIGFLSLNFADSPPLVDVGNTVSVGVAAAWALSVTLLPALMVVLPAPKRLPLLSDPRFLITMAGKVIAYRTPILIGSVVLVGVLGAGITRMQFDDDFIKYFSEDFSFRRDSDFVQHRLTGMHHLYFSAPSGREGGVTDPEYLAKIDAFAEWLRHQDHVTHVSQIADVVKRVNQSMNGDDPAYYRIPESKELAAQLLLLYEMALPAGFDLNSQVDITRSSSLVIARLANVTSEEIRQIAARSEVWLADHGMTTRATGLSVLYSHLTANNIRSMIVGSTVELIVISFLMILFLRSLRIGLISLIPNLIPTIMAYGLWGWLGTQVNLAISVVAAMTFGIVVDDTIHTLSKYQRYRNDFGMDPMSAVRGTYVAAGAPMLLIGVTLILGFCILAFSGFAVSYLMGMLSASVIGLAIVADLMVLPPLLLLCDRKSKSRVVQFAGVFRQYLRQNN